MDAWLAIAGFVLGVLGSWWALQDRLKDKESKAADAKVKEYAAQRDFNHLKENYRQLSTNLEVLTREQDEAMSDLRQMVRQNQLLLQMIVSKSGESISGILNS